MDGQTIGMCVIGFLLTLAIWLIRDSQRSIVRRIDRYELKNEMEHAKLSEALVQRGKEFHAGLAQRGKEFQTGLAQRGKEFHAGLAQRDKEFHAGLAQRDKEFHAGLAQRDKQLHAALAQQGKENREALAQQGKELIALRVEVAKLIGPTEREILESIRQLVSRSDVQERKPTDGDGN